MPWCHDRWLDVVMQKSHKSSIRIIMVKLLEPSDYSAFTACTVCTWTCGACTGFAILKDARQWVLRALLLVLQLQTPFHILAQRA